MRGVMRKPRRSFVTWRQYAIKSRERGTLMRCLAWALLAECLQKEKKSPEAETVMQRVYHTADESLGPEHVLTKQFQNQLRKISAGR